MAADSHVRGIFPVWRHPMKMHKLPSVTVLASVLALTQALAQGPGGMGKGPGMGMGPGFGWKQGPRGYYSGEEIPRERIEADAKALLQKAATGPEWTSPRGVTHIQIVVDKEIIGHLWEKVDLKTVEVGASWTGRWGHHVQLEKDKKVVGMIWLTR
jgi:hypothetical protein